MLQTKILKFLRITILDRKRENIKRKEGQYGSVKQEKIRRRN